MTWPGKQTDLDQLVIEPTPNGSCHLSRVGLSLPVCVETVMDWSNERYTRLYIRDTKTWILIGWEGQVIFSLLLRKSDRAGILEDVFTGEDICVILRNGIPIEVAEIGLGRLLKYKVIEKTQVGLLIPNYIEAQETPRSDAQRQRDSREGRRDKVRRDAVVTERDTIVSQNVTNNPHSVTPGHTVSQPVTPNCSLLNPDPKPVPNKKHTPARVEYPHDFETFWKVYPKKKKKNETYRAFLKAKKTGMPPIDKLIQIVEIQKRWQSWTKDGGQYIPYPSSWLNGGCWDDEPDASAATLFDPDSTANLKRLR